MQSTLGTEWNIASLSFLERTYFARTSGSILLSQLSVIIFTSLGMTYLGLSRGHIISCIADANIADSPSFASFRYARIQPPSREPPPISADELTNPNSLRDRTTASPIESTSEWLLISFRAMPFAWKAFCPPRFTLISTASLGSALNGCPMPQSSLVLVLFLALNNISSLKMFMVSDTPSGFASVKAA